MRIILESDTPGASCAFHQGKWHGIADAAEWHAALRALLTGCSALEHMLADGLALPPGAAENEPGSPLYTGCNGGLS